MDTTAKLVGFTLDTYADKHGVCFPSRQTVAAGAGLSRNNLHTVDQAICRLVARGFLEKTRGGGGRASNTYRLTIPEGRQQLTPQQRHEMTPQECHLVNPAASPDDTRTGSNRKIEPASTTGDLQRRALLPSEGANEEYFRELPFLLKDIA
jgi:hypothetical protein